MLGNGKKLGRGPRREQAQLRKINAMMAGDMVKALFTFQR